MELKVMLDKGAILPDRAHEDDAGLDLFSQEEVVVRLKESVTINTGVHVAIPKGHVGFIKSKSGLMVNHSILTDGTVDAGYTGAVRVTLFNHAYEHFTILKGQKIAQLVLLPIITPKVVLVEELEETERGSGGFGSTGAFLFQQRNKIK